MIAYILYNPESKQRCINAERLALYCESYLRLSKVVMFPRSIPNQKLIDKYPELRAGSISCSLSTMQLYTDFLEYGAMEMLYFQDDVNPSRLAKPIEILHHDTMSDMYSAEYPLGYICQVNETIDFLKEHDGNILSSTKYSHKLDHGNWVNDALIIDRQAAAITIKSYLEDFRVVDCHTRNPIQGITYYRSKRPVFTPSGFLTTIDL